MRPRISWVIASAIIAIGVLAALDALRSTGGQPPSASAEPDRSLTTAQTETGAEIESSARLRSFRAVRLIPGRIRTAERFDVTVTFTVPPGWYGYQGGRDFQIAKSPPSSEVATTFASGGVAVSTLDYRLAYALRELETTAGVRVFDDAPVHIGGYSGRAYALVLDGPLDHGTHPGIPDNLQPGERLILLGVGRKTLLIRSGSDEEAERMEVDRVLNSFRFAR